MTVSSQTNNETFYGNGVTTIWDLPFRFFDNAQIFAYLLDPAAQLTTPLVLGTDYTLTGAGLPEQFGTAPGKITTTIAVPSGKKLYVERVIAIEQLTDIINQGRFFPEVHEDVFDRLTMLLQQVNSYAKGAIRVAIGDPEPKRLVSAVARANLLMGFNSDGDPFAVSPISGSAADLALMLANSSDVTKGDAMIGVRQPLTGAGGRTQHDKNLENVTLKDFLAVGDGVANDTPAITAAQNYMFITGNNVRVTPGRYLIDPFALFSLTAAGQASFVGDDTDKCVFVRRGTGSTPFVTVGNQLSTSYQAGVGMHRLTIDGGAKTNGDAFRAWDMVWSFFSDMRFKGGDVACHLYGGIGNIFSACSGQDANYGLKVEKYPGLAPGSFSPAGGGWPNINSWSGRLTDNALWGCWFDHGRMLSLDVVQVEGNGTTLASPQGGIYAGPNIGSEIPSDPYSIGYIARTIWVEGSRGAADIAFESGINTVDGVSFFSNSASVTNAMVISGGRYTLRNANFGVPLTVQLSEGPGVALGNIIESSDLSTFLVDPNKTMVTANNVTFTRGGAVPVVSNLAKPLIQSNTTAVATGAAGVTINFAKAYASAPRVMATPNNGDTTTQIQQIVVSSVTTTGFFARGLQITSGSSTVSQVNLGFNWIATGTE